MLVSMMLGHAVVRVVMKRSDGQACIGNQKREQETTEGSGAQLHCSRERRYGRLRDGAVVAFERVWML